MNGSTRARPLCSAVARHRFIPGSWLPPLFRSVRDADARQAALRQSGSKLPHSKVRLAAALAATVALAAVLPAAAQGIPPDEIAKLKQFHFGGDSAVLDAIAQRVTEARRDTSPGSAARAAVAADLASALGPDATFDGRQFACRELVYVAGPEQIPALLPLLKDEQLAHYALMVLVHLRGIAAAEALASAVAESTGRTRAEILDAMADQLDGRAIGPLAEQSRSTDPALAAAAWNSLAKLPSQASLDALSAAFKSAPLDRKPMVESALLKIAYHPPDAESDISETVYRLLDADTAHPSIRAEALVLEAHTHPDQVLPLVTAALAEDGTPRQRAAAMLVRRLQGPSVTQTLCAALPALPEHGKVLLLGALADRRDPAAAAAVAAACSSTEPGVRPAALAALGAVGGERAVTTLLRCAASPDADTQAAARASLLVLRGKGVDSRLVEATAAGSPAVRLEAIRAVGDRHVEAALPALLEQAASPDTATSAAALRVVRDMAPPSEVPKLIGLLQTAPASERDTVVDAIATVARRGAGEAQQTGPILAALGRASQPADRAALLTVLGQVGGPSALRALRTAAADREDRDLRVRSAALDALAEWQTDEPMPDLLAIARTSQDPTVRSVALRGCVRMIALNDERPPDRTLALYREAAALGRTAADKRLLLAGLSRVPSIQALDYAASFRQDAEVRPEAELAMVQIGRVTAGAYRDRTKAALQPIASGGADVTVRAQAAAIVALIDRFDDWVTAWEVSPVYRQDGADFRRLFDVRFPPEHPGAPVLWRLIPAGGGPDQPWLVDLLAVHPGEQCVAYLRTAVWSAQPRDLVLELGSDDGVKAWLNGQTVVSDNTARAVAPGQEKAKVSLRAGWNQLLLKVTQNTQGWGAVARFTNPDGAPATGLRFAVPSEAR